MNEFAPGQTVFHRTFGEGVVIHADADRARVDFRASGEKSLLAWALGRSPEEAIEAVSQQSTFATPGPTTDPDPVDLWAHFDPPSLPTGLLPPTLEEFALRMGEMMGADPGGLAAAALAVCAAAIPDRIKLQVKRHDTHWTESSRLWVALIGTPSTKKSPILSAAVRPLAKIDAELWRRYAQAMAAYDDLPKEEKAKTDAPKQVRLRIEDTTIEAAQEVLKHSPDGVLCLQDELSGWFGAMDKYAGARGAAKDRGFWLQAFNGGSYAVNRIGRGSGFIENLSVSMLGGIQPEPLRKIAADAVDDGLLQRLCPIVLQPATLGKDEPSPDVAIAYDDLIQALHGLREPTNGGGGNLADMPATLRFDNEAQDLRRQLEHNHLDLMKIEAVNGKLAAHVGKFDGIFARLAIVWHCAENSYLGSLPAVISGATAERAALFLHEYLLPHAIAFYAGTLGLAADHDVLSAVGGYILAHDELKEITLRDVQRGDRTMRALTRDEASKVLERLEFLGWLSAAPMARNGTAPRWVVNPRVRELYRKRGEAEARRRREAREMIAEMSRQS